MSGDDRPSPWQSVSPVGPLREETKMMFRPTAIGLITAVLLGYGCSMNPPDSQGSFSGVVEG